jgi:hypothetical protein
VSPLLSSSSSSSFVHLQETDLDPFRKLHLSSNLSLSLSPLFLSLSLVFFSLSLSSSNLSLSLSSSNLSLSLSSFSLSPSNLFRSQTEKGEGGRQRTIASERETIDDDDWVGEREREKFPCKRRRCPYFKLDRPCEKDKIGERQKEFRLGRPTGYNDIMYNQT